MLRFTLTPPARGRAGGLLPASCEIDAVGLEKVEHLQKRGPLALMGTKTQRKGDMQELPRVMPVQFGRIFKLKMCRQSAKD